MKNCKKDESHKENWKIDLHRLKACSLDQRISQGELKVWFVGVEVESCCLNLTRRIERENPGRPKTKRNSWESQRENWKLQKTHCFEHFLNWISEGELKATCWGFPFPFILMNLIGRIESWCLRLIVCYVIPSNLTGRIERTPGHLFPQLPLRGNLTMRIESNQHDVR